VNEHIQDVTRRVAAAGYAALAPDLYADGGARPPPLAADRVDEALAFIRTNPSALLDAAAREAGLSGRAPAERARLGETLAAIAAQVGNRDRHAGEVTEAARWLREQDEAGAKTRGQRVGSVGFCMGGGLSARLACLDPELGAAVVFYGAPPPAELLPRIACPLLAFYGALDTRITSQVPAFEEALARAGKRFEKVVYEGAQHAFFNDSRPAYDVNAARDAWVRTLAFLRATLVPA